ncbi:MAG: radical SAM protein [Deltaproteobacteria bacterium]|nr:radical SAM protein [Deltaproteobacteria bacterium]MBW2072297.1 radical SAM protein [Deltaproteobacteria bacterium]
MTTSYHSSIPLSDFSLWQKVKGKRALTSFDLELTARCNNNCRHCYINVPTDDSIAKAQELTIAEIEEIAGEAVSLGALWCLITGGEPLLREDFFDIYLNLKEKGLLVSVFTNATLITDEHIRIFKKYPPRDIEVTVYGVTRATYERVTRNPGSFAAFTRGLHSLLDSGIKVQLKAMALRSNVAELPQIARFCRERTREYYRFDPFLHLRFDGNVSRNKEILSQRLFPSEIVTLEQADPERLESLHKRCDKLILPESCCGDCNHLFHCGVGSGSFAIGSDGFFRLCSSLYHPECIYDLRKGNLTDAWHNFVPQVRSMQSEREEFREKCGSCSLINLCLWCPAHAYLETGELDAVVDYYCRVAHARAEMLGKLEAGKLAGRG